MDPYRLAVIVGSTREGRFSPTVAAWFTDLARTRPDLVVEVVDLVDTPGPGAEFTAAIGRADAVVVVTPEYNHSFPGPLKTAIDSVRGEWFAKPVGFVSHGGISGGLRAVEPLRGVFAELHAVTIRETVSFAMAWEAFDGDGQPKDPQAGEAAHRLLDQLAW
ncbi:NADPH-dependent FMN reductase [Sporichthya sp.]|uniref:NADPH-dependent FMN reductase n=1 Tax=Sporichthya sp. TaxID=65475 RepID=UPI00178FD0E7|nr:NAD(P)H-dependent oxidoreductase [Sporichthya sp.]MBA3745847.1 NAD(P)H-dependent oxidoreductase [Sporichthya sp.]